VVLEEEETEGEESGDQEEGSEEMDRMPAWREREAERLYAGGYGVLGDIESRDIPALRGNGVQVVVRDFDGTETVYEWDADRLVWVMMVEEDGR
jgi:hypothetical protein